MILKPWEELPPSLRTEEVRPYYDILCQKKASLVCKRIFDVTVSALMLILLLRILPRTALLGLVQGIFNLIPLGESDGARILQSAMGLYYGKKPCKQGKEGVQ